VRAAIAVAWVAFPVDAAVRVLSVIFLPKGTFGGEVTALFHTGQVDESKRLSMSAGSVMLEFQICSETNRWDRGRKSCCRTTGIK
jgi:hypothetical protein